MEKRCCQKRRTDQELKENASRVPSNPSTEAKEEKMLRVLFKKNKDVRFKDEATGNIVDLIKYSDAQGNNTYLSFQEHQRIFQSGQVTEFILLEYTYDSLIRDFQRTKLKYPDSRTANIKSYSILTGKLLDSNEFDYSILEEIYQGRRNGRDTRFHGEVLEIYNADLIVTGKQIGRAHV